MALCLEELSASSRVADASVDRSLTLFVLQFSHHQKSPTHGPLWEWGGTMLTHSTNHHTQQMPAVGTVHASSAALASSEGVPLSLGPSSTHHLLSLEMAFIQVQ